MTPGLGGTQHPLVRADMVYFTTPAERRRVLRKLDRLGQRPALQRLRQRRVARSRRTSSTPFSSRATCREVDYDLADLGARMFSIARPGRGGSGSNTSEQLVRGGFKDETSALRVLVVGLGNMGLSHARAYRRRSTGFELAGLCTRTIDARARIFPQAWAGRATLLGLRRSSRGRETGCGVDQYLGRHACRLCDPCHRGGGSRLRREAAGPDRRGDAQRVVDAATAASAASSSSATSCACTPPGQGSSSWRARLGKPLVMRMNLNQQSIGQAWTWHRNLMQSLTPLVDCGVHYVDIMCQMTQSRPVRVHGIGARLSRRGEGRQLRSPARGSSRTDRSVGTRPAGDR